MQISFIKYNPQESPELAEKEIQRLEGEREKVPKFNNGWRWKNPLAYFQIFLLFLGAFFIINALKIKRKYQNKKEPGSSSINDR